MPAIGSCKDCCCTPCEINPACHPVCRCVPKALCVELSQPEGGDYCSCAAPDAYSPAAADELDWDCATNSYAGTLSCGELLIDVEFTFERIDGERYFCLESYCLGLTGENKLCLPFTSNSDCRNPEFEFSVNVGNCGDLDCGAAVITTSKADRIWRRPKCGECSDCKCWCRCLCLTYSDDECSETLEVCWDDYTQSWHGEIQCPYETITVTVALECDPLTGETTAALSTSIGDGDAQAITCPNISASWSLVKEDYSTATVTVACLKCGECDPEPILVDCCNQSVPADLTLTVENNLQAGGAEGPECECAEQSVPLVWNPTINRIENADPGGWEADLSGCGGRLVGFEMYCLQGGNDCGGFQWFLGEDCDEDGETFWGEASTFNAAVCSCNPFFQRLDGRQMGRCCDPDGPLVGQEINFVVTE